MRSCDVFRKYEGTKSQKIQQMINDKLQKQRKNEIGNVNEIPEVKKIVKEVQELGLAKKRLDAKIKQIQNQFMLDIYHDDYAGRTSVKYDDNSCIVPKKTIALLQRAQDLQSLGNTHAAKKIWDSVMKEYDVGQVPEM
jgi:hypothetical protein